MIRTTLALVALVAAAALALLAFDVMQTPARIARDDTRFYGAPLRQFDLWTDKGLVPWRAADRLLGTGDDRAFRHAIWLFQRTPRIEGENQPLLEALRGKAVLELAERSRLEHDPRRRSLLLNLSGVFTFAQYNRYSAGTDQSSVLKESVDKFRNAVRLDPNNLDARANLEQALRTAKNAGISGEGLDSGADRGKLTGIGRTGTGY